MKAMDDESCVCVIDGCGTDLYHKGWTRMMEEQLPKEVSLSLGKNKEGASYG